MIHIFRVYQQCWEHYAEKSRDYVLLVLLFEVALTPVLV
jgi:hypothetical protein